MPEWVNVIIRSTSLLITLFFFTKWLGKKQLSQLSIFEYITGIAIGSIAATMSMGTDIPIVHGFLSMSVWFVIPLLIGIITLKSKKIRDFIEGKGTVFIKDGKVMEDNLKKEKYTTDDLLEKLRNNNFFQVADVEFAVLETDGTLSILPKKENQPLTPKDLGLDLAPVKEPQTVIMDGKPIYEPLATAGLSYNWLTTELDKLGVTIENVFLGQIDHYGQLTVDLFDDNLKVPTPQELPLLLATMKKCQADLELFALATENQAAKTMYSHNSEKLQAAIERVKPFLNS
ncbi:DUF421 domain-containing protein [Radiobacillus sp. PE A8.2]|uniref:DUF421 domain-containing protein n=1 Tax=Radiobacillus sp. PE A8.2 TaxID=3380349 RepID=UPI00389085CE